MKKEIFELIKTKKILIIPLSFFFFALTSPIIALFLPELIQMLPVDGIVSDLPAPTMKDSYLQLLENYNEMGYFIVILVSTGILISDKTKGRLIFLLSKPIKRTDALLGKYLVVSGKFVSSVLLGSVFFIPYTIYLFHEFHYLNYLLVLFLYCVYGLFLITLTLFSTVYFKNYLSSLIFTVSTFLSFSLFNQLESHFIYLLPGKLTMLQMQILDGTINHFHLILSLISTIILIFILFWFSFRHFKEQEIE